MNETPSNPGPTNTETLFGRAPIVVNFRNGGIETHSLQQLSVDQFPALLSALDDEQKQVELYCGQPAGWAKLITAESHEQIMTEGDRLNADFFSRWVQRRLARQEKLRPGLTQNLIEQAAAKLLTQASASGSLKSPTS